MTNNDGPVSASSVRARLASEGIDALLGLYRTMLLIRSVELEIERANRQGRITGSFHSSMGQEACAAGVCAALLEVDIVTSTHRGHGHAIAKGVPVDGIFAELFGRETGVSGGRGGSMHLHHRESGFYGETAIVAGGLAWAAGAAWARRRQGLPGIAVAFLGDGGFAQGATHEALLLAAHWRSPCLFVCENNGLAHSMSSEQLFGKPGKITELVAARGIESAFVDGRDVLEVAKAAARLTDHVRATERPAFLECSVFRVRPHSISDPDYRYRDRGAGETWLETNDPIERARSLLITERADDVEAAEAEIAAVVARALEAAETASPTPAASATTSVYATPELNVTRDD